MIDGFESVCERTELNAVAVTIIERSVDSASHTAAQREIPNNTVRRNLLAFNVHLSEPNDWRFLERLNYLNELYVFGGLNKKEKITFSF